MGRPKKTPGLQKPPRRMWGFRMTESALEFLRVTAEKENRPKAVVALRCIEDARDTRQELGPEWYEIERQANIENVSAGTMLARLARLALQKAGKK